MPVSLHGVCTASTITHCKSNSECTFPFLSFLVKDKGLFGFLLVRADTTESFAKAKLHNVNWIPIIELYATLKNYTI